MRNADSSDRPFSLELAQRDLLNITDEPMPFSAATIASVIRQIVSGVSDADRAERLFLRAVADALDNPAAEWRLSLARTIRGRFVPPDKAANQQARDALIEYWMERATSEHGKVEAAIADVSVRLKVSRATIFQALKRQRELQTLIDQFDGWRPDPIGKD